MQTFGTLTCIKFLDGIPDVPKYAGDIMKVAG